jgi:AcrR family transcriptional regulator
VSVEQAKSKQARAGAEKAPARGRGRPRSEEAHQAILGATLRLLDEGGYRHLTIEAVAARAGVGKTTIYRRWSSKLELVIEAVDKIRPPGPPEDTGTLAGDFAAFQQGQMARVARTPLPRIAPRLISEALGDPELHAAFMSHVVQPLRDVLRVVLKRGMERGELRPDLDLDLATDVVHGTIVYRILIAQGDIVAATRPVPRILDLLRVPA